MKTQFKYCLGTAIKIVTVLDNLATADSAKITIEDPAGTNLVDGVAMTKDEDNVYYYIYQTSDSNAEGTYTVTVEIKLGSYVSRKQATFSTYDPNI